MRATSLTRTGPACRTFRTFRTAPRRGCDRQDRAHLSPELKSTHWTKHRGPVKINTLALHAREHYAYDYLYDVAWSTVPLTVPRYQFVAEPPLG
jgi:hypothetical protein